MSKTSKPVITPILFDSSVKAEILSYFYNRFEWKCRYCRKDITVKNLSAITHQGFICNALPCLIEFTGEDVFTLPKI